MEKVIVFQGKMLQKIFISLIIVLFISNLQPARGHSLARVKRVIDGDTYVVYHQGRSQTLRLACVDTLENQQPLGLEATNYVRELLPVRSQITYQYKSRHWERVVAEITTPDGDYLNNLLLTKGYGVLDPRYSRQCAVNLNRMREIQETARKQKVGIWANENPIMPWDFRRK